MLSIHIFKDKVEFSIYEDIAEFLECKLYFKDFSDFLKDINSIATKNVFLIRQILSLKRKHVTFNQRKLFSIKLFIVNFFQYEDYF